MLLAKLLRRPCFSHTSIRAPIINNSLDLLSAASYKLSGSRYHTLAMGSSQELSEGKQADATATATSVTQDGPTPGQQRPAFDIRSLARDRMARQASSKRERSISPPIISRKAPKLDASTVTLESGARLTSFSTLVQHEQHGRKSAAANAANRHLKGAKDDAKPKPENALPTPPSTQPGDLQYPTGVVKKTWAFGHDRTSKDIKLEEVLEPQSLRTAVLSAFQWDVEWVLSKLKVPQNGGQTKCIFVMQAKEESLKEEMLEQTKDQKSWLRLCFPSMEGQIHCMHSKLMLLFHPNKLRIAIPTANLLNFDWGETGVMENSVWLIDLPRLPDGEKTTRDDLTAFAREMLFFCQRQGIDQAVRDGVLNFDFTATADIAFVHTVGGVSYGKDAERTGLPGLAKAVRGLNVSSLDPEIDFAASSIGSLNDDFLRHVQAAASGQDMIARAEATVSAAKSSFFQAKTKSPSDHSIRDKIRLYFPSHDTVTSSKAGAVGTICLSRKWFEAMTFPRRCFRDYISTRPGLLSHNKILYVRGVRKEGDEVKRVAWAYVGSSNMSESAWGKLVYDKKAKEWKLNCRNWECGVLLPVDVSDKEGEGAVGMEVFDEMLEPPFMYPALEYEDREPWYFQEKH